MISIIKHLRMRNKVNVCRRLLTRSKKYVLGIESSCDETGAAIIDEDGAVLGEGLKSQMKTHLENGGVIPHIAVHLHKENIDDVVSTALRMSSLCIKDMSAIAVTTKPGLKGSLLVGVEYSQNLAKLYKKPLIPIHHMEAHALTARLCEEVPFPFLVLLASGGHCQIALVKNVDKFLLLGTSQHNSPGEVLDKIARRLKLQNFPECSEISGGKAIEFMSQNGNPRIYDFPVPMTQYRDCDFSFAGFGSYAMAVIQQEERKHDVPPDGVIPGVQDFCASLLYAYSLHLMHRVQRAFIFCEDQNLIPNDRKTLVFSGGVACNTYIRNALQVFSKSLNYRFCCPPPKLCTDNGIMIAWNGVEKLKTNSGILHNAEDIEIDPDCPLGMDISDSVRKAAIKVRVPRIPSVDPMLVHSAS